jgi:hypothetical protein
MRNYTSAPKALNGNISSTDRLRSSIDRLRETSAEFVRTELELSITFCEVALSTRDFNRAQRSLNDARRAYAAAIKFASRMRKNGAKQVNAIDFADKVERLHSLFAEIDSKRRAWPNPTVSPYESA